MNMTIAPGSCGQLPQFGRAAPWPAAPSRSARIRPQAPWHGRSSPSLAWPLCRLAPPPGSLMALTLSVGFVVDDAIVVLENIVRHIEMGEKVFEAALNGTKEIGFTILSMTLSLAAVFIPLLFMGGIIGRLFREFAVTIAVAILVSGFVSLTLTPMLCARYLK